MLEIKKTNWGIASRQGNIIYINKNLTRYPGLFKAILEHEKKHTSGFKIEDIYLDLQNEDIKELKEEYYSFIIQHPRSWIEFLPIWFYNKKLVINPLLILLWIFLIIMGGFFAFVLTRGG